MPRKPSAKTAAPKTKAAKKEKVVEKVVETPNAVEILADGVYEGVYSKTVIKDGQKISFDIDWDKLREHLRTV